MRKQYINFLKKAMWVTVVVFVIRCLVSWKANVESISVYSLFGFAGDAIAVATFVMVAYERKLWKFNPFESLPVLKKVYKGTFKSSCDNLERTARLEIKQTLLSIRITFLTDESKSTSLSASINEVCGEKQLTYCYHNIPKAEFRHRSEIHYGTAQLCVDDPNILTGLYYTDRKTIGDMVFYAVEED